jgi:hypothetical protein
MNVGEAEEGETPGKEVEGCRQGESTNSCADS